MHLPLESDGAKVREGKSGGGAVLSAEVRTRLDELWQEEIAGELGYADYAALADALVAGE